MNPFLPIRSGKYGAALGRIAGTALACGLLCATLVRFSPGFGVDERQLDARLSGGSQQAIRRAHDDERNPVRFYVTYVGRMLTGNLGFSHSLGRPIRGLLAERTPATAALMATGAAGAWLLALVLAVPPLAWRMPRLEAMLSTLSGASACLPAAGVALILFRAGVHVKWMLPVILFPRVYQYVGNLLRQSYSMPHVLLARAKGLSTSGIFFRHVLPPARAQLVALAAVSINAAFGAAVAVEAICDLPGLGQLAWKAALARDLQVLVIVAMMIALMTQLSRLAAEIASPAARSEA
jgi:peptide/nickel transport system permease protein